MKVGDRFASHARRRWFTMLGATLVAGLLGSLLVSTPAAADPEGPPQVGVYPRQLVFSTVQGQPCTAMQQVTIVSRVSGQVAWQVTTDEPWLQASATSGQTPAPLFTTVDCLGLGVGVHEASLTVDGGSGEPVTVAVSVIVNPATPVRLATWKDGHRGAFSVSTDDGFASGFDELVAAGRAGTFVMNGINPPARYDEMYAAGMEIGSHLNTHPCNHLSEEDLRWEIETNIDGLLELAPITDIVSLVWPCGYTDLDRQYVAAEYFMSARGYNINELEDPTPTNFMNLKSYNSHEHTPFPPADLKTIVDAAEAEGKWANLVLHEFTNDDGAIAYGATKDVWFAPIGDVIKYILQRDRTVISQYQASANSISFDFSRLAIPGTVLREFEPTIKATDQVTFQVDVTSLPSVSGVSVGGNALPFQVRDEGTQKFLYFSASVGTTAQTAQISLSGTVPPVLVVSPSSVSVSVPAGGSVPDRVLAVSNGGGGSLDWSASVDSGWLSVSPSSGSGAGSVTVSVDASGLAPGSYSGAVTVTAAGAAGSPRVVPVNLTVQPPMLTEQFVFDYPDRASLLADGWDFLARTAGGATRDTEQPGQVSYSASGLGIPAGPGDLWADLNNSRNNLFRDLPSSWTSVAVRLDFAPTGNYQQAGIVVYDDDDNYVQIMRDVNEVQAMELVQEVNGFATVIGHVPTNATTNVHLRLDRDLATGVIQGYYSFNGTSWQQLGVISQSSVGARLGIVVGANESGGVAPVATIREVVVTSPAGSELEPVLVVSPSSVSVSVPAGGSVPDRVLAVSNGGGGSLDWSASVDSGWLSVSPSSGSGAGSVTVSVDASGLAPGSYSGAVTVTAAGASGSPRVVPVNLTVEEVTPGVQAFVFDYPDRASLLADGWDFLARTAGGATRDTEQPGQVSYSASGLGIPAGPGDLWEGLNDSRNSVFRDLPSSWTSVELSLGFAPTGNYQQAGIVVYDDDDNYVQITRNFNSWSGGQSVAFVSEAGGSTSSGGSLTSATSLRLRLVRSGSGVITASFSVDDGATWAQVGSAQRQFTAPRVGIVVGANESGGVAPVATIREVVVTLAA